MNYIGAYAAALVLGLSCGPDRPGVPERERASEFASAMCEAFASCGCATTLSFDECMVEYREDFLTVAGNLDLDVACFEAFLDVLVEDPCAATDGEVWTSAILPCAVFSGTKSAGASCTRHPEIQPLLVDECGDGLRCAHGVCADESQTEGKKFEVGDSCTVTDSLICNSLDLFCDVDTCAPKRPNGQPCQTSAACAEGYCPTSGEGGEGLCTPHHDLGETCEPLDFLNCVDVAQSSGSFSAWCDPSTKTCVAGPGPRVCRASLHR